MQRKQLCALALGTLLLLTGCSNPFAATGQVGSDEAVTKDLFAMDTVMTITAYGSSKAVDDAVAEIKRLDALLSISSDTGEIKPINDTGSGKVSQETADLLRQSLDVCKETNGVYDITILPVMELWGFTTQNYTVPDAATLQKTLKLVDYRKITLSADNVVTIPKEMGLDLGGIAKGYASDRLMEVFKQDGVQHALVSLGGNVQALGTRPDGSDWHIGVQNPKNLEDYIGVIVSSNKAITTAGSYQRYFDKDGVRYHHIIDPSTGYPAKSGLSSVTIVSDSGVISDGVDTPMFVMGLEKGSAFWRAHKDEFDAVFITDSDEVYVTAGLKDRFTLKSGGTFHVIE